MSSTTRRTAFARVPRGKSGQGSANPAQFQINKAFLDNMTQARVAPDMATILTKTSSALAITVQPNGKGNFTINAENRVIGDSADVQKVQSLGTFVNDERKAILKTSVSSIAKKTIAAIVLVSTDPAFADSVPRPITRIDKAFVDIFRTVNAQADMLNVNLQQINQSVPIGDVNEMVRNHLIETGSRIREALGEFLMYRGGLADGEDPRKLNDFLYQKKVISWVFTRLCAQKMQLNAREFEFRKLYFPKDPTKGLQVTFKEFKSRRLLGNQGGILGNLAIFRGLWTDVVLRPVCGIPDDWNLTTFEGPAKVLSNVPIMVVPCPGAVTLEEHFAVLAQNGDRGLPWNVGSTVTPQDTLKYLGTIPKRISYGFLGMPRFSAPWYENLFPGFRFDLAVAERENRSVFGQLQTQFRSGTINSEFFSTICGENGYARARATMPPLILAVMDMPPDNDLSRTVLDALGNGMIAIANGETQVIVDVWAAITSRRQMTDEICERTLSGILTISFDNKVKSGKDGDIRTARSSLSLQGSSLIREFRRRGYKALATRVDIWLRSFLTTTLQGAVAEVISARLEASLATPIQFGRGDTAVYLEPAEFADENATEADDAVDGDASEASGEAENPDDN